MGEERINGGYVLLARKIVGHPLYKLKPDHFVVGLHLLLTVAWKTHTIRTRHGPLTIPRGSRIIGRKTLADELNLGVQVIRTGLDKCKALEFLTTKLTTAGTLVSIVNYDSYQDPSRYANQESNQTPTRRQPDANHNIIKRRKRRSTEKKLVGAKDGEEREKPPVPEILLGLSLYEKDETLCAKLTDDLLAAWKVAYPGLDIRSEIAQAHAWEMGHPKRQKKDRVAYLTNWMNRSQDRARPTQTVGQGSDWGPPPMGGEPPAGLLPALEDDEDE